MKAYNALKYVQDYLASPEFDNYVQNTYWTRDFDEDLVFETISRQAIQDGLYLEDLDEQAGKIYDLILDAYEVSEKGLS